jgi:hypothetical protein
MTKMFILEEVLVRGIGRVSRVHPMGGVSCPFGTKLSLGVYVFAVFGNMGSAFVTGLLVPPVNEKNHEYEAGPLVRIIVSL